MLYNERITTDASAGAKVYEGNQGQAIMKQGQEWKQQAAKELEQAKDLEKKGYKLGLAKGMNELWADEKLSSNPQALAAEMDKMAESVTANIADKDTKVDVLTDFELKKDSYINQATTKMKRIQEEKARSAAFDAIYANIDSLSRAFGNGVSGNYNEGDVVNYQYSLDRIKANINARNPDGTYMFSDAQRRAMARDADRIIAEGFESIYYELPEEKQKEIAQKLNDGTYSVANFAFKDIVGEEGYKDIQRKVNRRNQAVEAAKQVENEEKGKSALSDFFDSLTYSAIGKVQDFIPNLKKESVEKLKEAADTEPNYKAKTTYAGSKDLDAALNKFANAEYKNYEDAVEDAVDLITKSMKANSKDKGVGKADSDEYKNKVLGILRDEQVKRGFQELSTYKMTFWDYVDTTTRYMGVTSPALWGRAIKDDKISMHTQYIENLAQESVRIADGYIINGKPEEAKKVLKEYRRKIFYAAHPEFDGKKKGDTVDLNGIIYEITGDESVRFAK